MQLQHKLSRPASACIKYNLDTRNWDKRGTKLHQFNLISLTLRSFPLQVDGGRQTCVSDVLEFRTATLRVN